MCGRVPLVRELRDVWQAADAQPCFQAEMARLSSLLEQGVQETEQVHGNIKRNVSPDERFTAGEPHG